MIFFFDSKIELYGCAVGEPPYVYVVLDYNT